MNKPLNQYFDHTILKPEATTTDVEKLCKEARDNKFYSVCVNSSFVEKAKEFLMFSDVKVCAVVGFPLGACMTEVKSVETTLACECGAEEIDMVINVGALKEGDYELVLDDIAEVVAVAGDYDATVKVIIETCLLTKEEIVKACELAEEAGAAFVKTSTGFSKGGATVEDVKLMRETVGDRLQVKASGGIRDYETCMAMIEAGADRVGASASVQIMEEAKKH